jgi:hypothetical protein
MRHYILISLDALLVQPLTAIEAGQVAFAADIIVIN